GSGSRSRPCRARRDGGCWRYSARPPTRPPAAGCRPHPPRAAAAAGGACFRYGSPRAHPARAVSPARPPPASSAAPTSAPIVGVDIDVAVSEVAGPHPRPALADADVDGDGDVATPDMLGHRRFVVVGASLPLLGDGHAADTDAQAVAVGLLAGL